MSLSEYDDDDFEDEDEEHGEDVCWICFACGEINHNMQADKCSDCGEKREEQ